jgi:hypothetical protein
MTRWLLLAHSLPTTPSNARVKTWRRLQDIGAVQFRNSVYVLPNTESCREDFEWLRTEIAALGGEATVFAAEAFDPSADADLERAFRRARDADYTAVIGAAKALTRRGADATLARKVHMLTERVQAIRAIDFFHAPMGDAAADALAALEQRLAGPTSAPGEGQMPLQSRMFANRRWVTRPRPGVDRMASAWLIRRFIDSKATFAFAAEPSEHDVAFDMYTGEFSHHRDLCTFEVLAQRFGIRDPAVGRVAQIVHDLDMKENRYSAPEAPAVSRMIEGLRQLHADDATLLEQGMAMFEALARSFESAASAPVTLPERRATRRSKKTAPTRKRRKKRST